MALHGGGKKNCRKKVTLFIKENAKRPAFEIECVDRIRSLSSHSPQLVLLHYSSIGGLKISEYQIEVFFGISR